MSDATRTVPGCAQTAPDDVFTEVELVFLELCEATDADRLRLARVEPAEARNKAVDRFASGYSIDKAIAGAEAEYTAEQEAIANGNAPPVTEHGLSDAEWLQAYCGELRGQLQDTTSFDADAILYRRDRNERQVHRILSRDLVAEAMKQGARQFAAWLSNIFHIEHPGNWCLCRECRGRNLDNPECGYCRGAGYVIRQHEPNKAAG